MIDADNALLLVGLALVLLGLSSRVVKTVALSPALLALLAGVAVGPLGLGLVTLTPSLERGPLLEQLARVALALSVTDIALRLRPSDLRADARRVGVLLLVVMPGMWLLTSLGAGLLLGLPVAVALLLGAALTPTDPGVASALVTGVLPNRSLPRRVRTTLQAEAAANDGLALPFVLFAGLLASLPPDQVAGAFVREAGVQLLVAVVVGTVAGFAVRKLVELAGVDRLAEEDWFPLAGAGLALTALGLSHALGGTGVFAAFVAGLVFAEGLPEDQREPVLQVHGSISKVGLAVFFLGFGTVLPADRWLPELGLAGVLFALWALVLRRLPVALPAVRATGTGTLSSAFIGWSGPLGVAGVYYLAFAERYQLPEYDRLFLAGTLAVAVSVAANAATAPLTVLAYRRRTGQVAEEGEELTLDGPLP